VKTLYCAPYVGAAKAAIAKFLGIKVSQITTTGENFCVSTPVTKMQSTGGSKSEFDDSDDEELASFDLDAALSSAKKQTCQPSINPYKQQLTTPVYNKVCTNVGQSSKPPTNPNKLPQLKSNSHIIKPYKNLATEQIGIDQLKVEKESLQKDIKTISEQKEVLKNETQQEVNKLKGRTDALRGGVEELKQEKTRLEREINQLKQDKIASEAEARDSRKNADSWTSKSVEEKREHDKLKGRIRAIREEYNALVADVKKTHDQKDALEKAVSTVKAEKDRLQSQVNEAKKDLSNIAKPTATLKSGDESNSTSNRNNEEGPPAKKRKSKKGSGSIVASMKVADLGAEAIARGMEVKAVSRMNKDQLVRALVIGSSCVTKTDTWAEVLRVREKFEAERKLAQEEENRRQEALQAEWEKEQRKQREEEMKRQVMMQAEREKARVSEIALQAKKHVHNIPKVHGCKLAKTTDISLHGEPRSLQYSLRCSECSVRFGIVYTCETCDFDICGECFKEKTMTAKEKKAEAKRKADLLRQQQEAEAERRRLEEEEEEEWRKKWDAKVQFKSNIIDPPHGNLNSESTKGYIVYSSDGYDYDGFHSYEGPPEKEFDSTWSTKANANARARYLFHWKNPWGHGPDDMVEQEEVDESKTDGLVKYVVSPADSSTWTVAVVPAMAFQHMDNTRKYNRNNYYNNYDYEPTIEIGF